MSDYPGDLRYTKSHEWVRVSGKEAVFGITSFAQHELGDIVFVELPAVGGKAVQGEKFGVVESVKAVSDLFSPVSGRIVRVNADLIGSPELVNREPYGKGWMIAVELSDPKELDRLLSAQAYQALAQAGGH